MSSSSMDAIMTLSPVIPVLVLDDPATARPIAEALVDGGLRVLEVTLRTPQALAVLSEMRKVKGAVVGAGTVISAADMKNAREAGAQFIVSPGLTMSVVEAARELDLPLLPGIANASDLMRGLEWGLTRFKFFPAEASGGTALLKALSAPFRQCRFCPTGGITLESAPDWFALDSVLCVGGSWIVPPGPPDLGAIRSRAAKAAALTRPIPTKI